MIADTINQKIADALKAHDDVRLSTFRMLSSALNYEKIAKQHDLSEDEELAVVKKEAKKRTDAITALEGAAGKQTSSTPEELQKKLDNEKAELSLLKEFLPEEMDESELGRVIDETISEMNATSLSEMGSVIGAVRGKVGIRAEGGKIAQIVKQKLQ